MLIKLNWKQEGDDVMVDVLFGEKAKKGNSYDTRSVGNLLMTHTEWLLFKSTMERGVRPVMVVSECVGAPPADSQAKDDDKGKPLF